MASENAQRKPGFCENLKTQCTNFGNFLYDGEGHVMGRTGRSWAKIGVFYFFFYGFLAAFFTAMLSVFLSTINKPEDGGPKLTQFIKNQPGLTRLDRTKDFLENFKTSDTKDYTDFIKAKLDVYKAGDIYGDVCNATDTDGIPESADKPCYFDTTLLGPCNNASNGYGLADSKPCVFIRINKVYDWVPIGNPQFLELSCEGAKVYPAGFLIAGFPFRGVKGHELPLVAVQIDVKEKGKEMEVDCKLKGKNIEVSSSFNPVRSYGNIRIDGVERHKDD